MTRPVHRPALGSSCADGSEPSPPPYEVAETPLERPGTGFGYMLSVVGGAFLLNLLVMVLLAGANGA